MSSNWHAFVVVVLHLDLQHDCPLGHENEKHTPPLRSQEGAGKDPCLSACPPTCDSEVKRTIARGSKRTQSTDYFCKSAPGRPQYTPQEPSNGPPGPLTARTLEGAPEGEMSARHLASLGPKTGAYILHRQGAGASGFTNRTRVANKASKTDTKVTPQINANPRKFLGGKNQEKVKKSGSQDKKDTGKPTGPARPPPG